MKVKINPGSYLPTRAHATDAGLDLYSMEDKTLYPSGWTTLDPITNIEYPLPFCATFDTGVHIAFEPGTYGKIESKSGLNVKHSVVSCGGVVDEGYTGSIAVKLYNLGTEPYTVHKGDKIAQLVIMPYFAPKLELVSVLDDTARGDNGFGSTGK